MNNIEINAKINGKEVPLSTISTKTFEEIRRKDANRFPFFPAFRVCGLEVTDSGGSGVCIVHDNTHRIYNFGELVKIRDRLNLVIDYRIKEGFRPKQ